MKKSMVFEAVAVLLLILFLFLIYAMIAGSAPVVKEQWNMTSGQVPYLYASEDGTLYLFNSDHVRAIAADGSDKWSISIPNNRTMIDSDFDYNMFGGSRSEAVPAFASHNGILYLYTRPRVDINQNPIDLEENITPVTSVMAISSDGKILWDTPLITGSNGIPVNFVNISVSNDRVYVYYGRLAVFSTNGSLLFRLNDIMAPPTVDEQGDIYAVKHDGNGSFDSVYGYTGTFNTIVAYRPNGTLWWQKVMNDSLQYSYIDLNLNLANSNMPNSQLPIYHNNIVYVPLKKSLVALDRYGNELWSADFRWEIHPFLDMTFDTQNNIYLVESTQPNTGSNWKFYQGVKVAPDGRCSNYTIMRDNNSPMTVNNGIGYYVNINNWIDQSRGSVSNPSYLTDLVSQSIAAVDLETGQTLWNFTVPINNINEITLDPSNVYYMDEISADMEKYSLYYSPSSLAYLASANASIDYNKKHPELQSINKSAIGPWRVAGAGTMKLLPGDNVVYMSYFMYNYEYPSSLIRPPYNDESDAYKYPHAAVFNRSKLAYVSGILALDNNGRLLWNKPTNSMVTTMAANNSTIYYGTGDGKLSATQVNIAVGFALTAMAYLFLRFVCVGAVARAKARLNKNDNRNIVLDFIVRNPGSSLYEITRGTGVNLGTVRYHLFILGLNHKIVASQTDGKFVRYFTNSGTYSKDEQLILSLMRREAIGRTLGLMLERPGISNVEIVKELDIKESVVSRHIKELTERSIIENGTGGYAVKDEHRQAVADMMRHFFS
jgi:hypothetical protein